MVDLPQIMKRQSNPPPPAHMDLISHHRNQKRNMKVQLKTDLMNPFDPTLGNPKSKNQPATTEDLLIIRERQRELKELIRVTRGGKNGGVNPTVKDRMSIILNKGASGTEENTLDRYLKEHTH